MASPIRAPAFFFRGIRHLFRQQDLWPWVFLTYAVNLLVYGLAVAAFIYYFPKITAWSPDWASTTGEVIVGILAVLIALAILLFTFTLVGNALAGPFLDQLAQKMMTRLGETPPPGRSVPLQILISIGRQVLKLFLFGVAHLLLFSLNLIPIAGQLLYAVLAPLLLFYFFGLEYIDYPLDVRGLGILGRHRFALRHLGSTLLYGCVVGGITMIPFLGYFFLPVSVVGAVLLVREVEPPA